jgi:transcriptional regulator with XRE-family HTH domain
MRLERGLTQDAFGKIIGLKKQAVSDIEHCRITTSLENLYKLAEHFNISADYLLGLTDDPKRH